MEVGPLLLAAACLGGLPAAQRAANAGEVRLGERAWPTVPRGTWFTGDTHEHVQNCDGSLFPPERVLARMRAEGLNVANLLVWDHASQPFTGLVCAITGTPEALSTDARILQYGVETAGLDAARWGHLVGLGIGPDQARIAQGSTAESACADMPGLGLGCAGGDGTGVLNAPVAAHFLTAPHALVGYAHSGWTLGIHHPEGYDWTSELLASGFTTDARFLDPGRPLAFPDLHELLEPGHEDASDHGEGGVRSYFPLLGPIDAALGEAQFFETTLLRLRPPFATTPPSDWTGLYYKLLAAGLRVSITAGSDRACPLPGVERPQTSVSLSEGLTYEAWTRGIARGRTTLGVPGLRVELLLDGRGVGDELDLAGPDARASASLRVASAATLRDELELVVDGAVVAAVPVDLPFGGSAAVTLPELPFAASGWVAARLASRRAHTAAIHVIVDGAPVSDPFAAEYWMMWCDALTKRTLERPDLELFGCQEGEALERIARARRAFQTLRDVGGFDPAWGVARFGAHGRSCRGPIAIGIGAPVVAGQPFRLTCVNAPPSARGIAYVSRAVEPVACVDGALRLVSTRPEDLVAALPVVATPSGLAEVIAEASVDDEVLFAQLVWSNPPGCAATGCDGVPAPASASDALKIVVH